jgi:hypothetical protein
MPGSFFLANFLFINIPRNNPVYFVIKVYFFLIIYIFYINSFLFKIIKNIYQLNIFKKEYYIIHVLKRVLLIN